MKKFLSHWAEELIFFSIRWWISSSTVISPFSMTSKTRSTSRSTKATWKSRPCARAAKAAAIALLKQAGVAIPEEHRADFAFGNYVSGMVAKDKGYYDEAGLNVDIVVEDDVEQVEVRVRVGLVDRFEDRVGQFAVFVVFAYLYLGERVRWNHAWLHTCWEERCTRTRAR